MEKVVLKWLVGSFAGRSFGRMSSGFGFENCLPENERRRVVINGGVFFVSIGRLDTPFDARAAAACEQARYHIKDQVIQQPQ